jgi:hypothetical protein
MDLGAFLHGGVENAFGFDSEEFATVPTENDILVNV